MTEEESEFEFVGDRKAHWYAAVPDPVLREIFAAGYKERELDVREDDHQVEKVIDRKFKRFKEAKLRGTDYDAT